MSASSIRLFVRVGDFENVERFDACGMRHRRGRGELHFVSFASLEENARNRADPTHVTVRSVGFVDPDDANLMFIATLVRVEHRGPEKDLVRSGTRGGIHYFGRLDAFVQKADAAVDFTEASFPVLIVSVFTAVAVARGPAHDIHHFRTLDVDEVFSLVKQSAVTGGRHVIFGIGGKFGKRDFIVVFSHDKTPWNGIRLL